MPLSESELVEVRKVFDKVCLNPRGHTPTPNAVLSYCLLKPRRAVWADVRCALPLPVWLQFDAKGTGQIDAAEVTAATRSLNVSPGPRVAHVEANLTFADFCKVGRHIGTTHADLLAADLRGMKCH